jgi:hypothetical protein
VETHTPLNWSILHGCQVSDLCSPVSIKDLSIQNKVTIYPNPAREFIFLNGYELINKIFIHNAFGSLIKEYTSQEQINVSTLSPGLYIMKIILNDGYIEEIKVVLN